MVTRSRRRLIFICTSGLGIALVGLFRKDLNSYFDLQKRMEQSKLKLSSVVTSHLVHTCAKYSRRHVFHTLRIPEVLVALSNAKNETFHDIGIKALSVVYFGSEEAVERLKPKCEVHTLVSLARSPGTSPKWFDNYVEQDMVSSGSYTILEEKMVKLLKYLYDRTSDTCTLWMIEESLKLYNDDFISEHEPEHHKVYWAFGEDTLLDYYVQTIPKEKKWKYYLDTLKHASSHESDCSTLLRSELLNLLKDAVLHFHDNDKLLCLCGEIVANLAVIEEAHRHIVHSGFISIAKQFIYSCCGAVSSAGVRLLHNLDAYGRQGCALLDGIHLVYPERKADLKDFEVDVVFIHGLSGGPFWTWRQKRKDQDNGKTWSSCWPKDWLAKDVPNARIFCVEYNTHLTNWGISCPYTKETHSLSSRAKELKTKLLQAGLGKRPIVWVTHSMGGLIVKDILTQVDSENSLLSSTHGIVFYSVPHRGSPLAKQVSQAKYIVFPSIEVTDLQQNSPDLLQLHSKFIDLLQTRNIHVVSLLETLPLEIPVLKVKVKIVPFSSAEISAGNLIEVDQNHVFVCKPESKKDPSYTEVLKLVRTVVQERKYERISKHIN